MNVAEYIEAHRAKGMNMHKLAQLVGLSYSTVQPHVRKGKPLEVATARKLVEWSEANAKDWPGGVMTLIAILEYRVQPEAPPSSKPPSPKPPPSPGSSPKRLPRKKGRARAHKVDAAA